VGNEIKGDQKTTKAYLAGDCVSLDLRTKQSTTSSLRTKARTRIRYTLFSLVSRLAPMCWNSIGEVTQERSMSGATVCEGSLRHDWTQTHP
jgi:hypothetical protein